jgi:hypothetical protein
MRRLRRGEIEVDLRGMGRPRRRVDAIERRTGVKARSAAVLVETSIDQDKMGRPARWLYGADCGLVTIASCSMVDRTR